MLGADRLPASLRAAGPRPFKLTLGNSIESITRVELRLEVQA